MRIPARSAHCRAFIEDGRIQVWTVDGIDVETFFARDLDPQVRMARYDAYLRYVREEVLPRTHRRGARVE